MFNPGSLVKTKQEVRREILTIDTEELSEDLSNEQRSMTDKLVEITKLENKKEHALDVDLTDIANQLSNSELSTYQTDKQLSSKQAGSFFFQTYNLKVKSYLEDIYDRIQ